LADFGRLWQTLAAQSAEVCQSLPKSEQVSREYEEK
jgi:hypothetical protein